MYQHSISYECGSFWCSFVSVLVIQSAILYRSVVHSRYNWAIVGLYFWGQQPLQQHYMRHRFSWHNVPIWNPTWTGKFPSAISVQYRIRCLAIEVFNAFMGIIPPIWIIIFSQSILKYDLKDSFRLEPQKFHPFTYGFRSFRYFGSKLRNILPHSVKNTKDINVFKKNITE